MGQQCDGLQPWALLDELLVQERVVRAADRHRHARSFRTTGSAEGRVEDRHLHAAVSRPQPLLGGGRPRCRACRADAGPSRPAGRAAAASAGAIRLVEILRHLLVGLGDVSSASMTGIWLMMCSPLRDYHTRPAPAVPRLLATGSGHRPPAGDHATSSAPSLARSSGLLAHEFKSACRLSSRTTLRARRRASGSAADRPRARPSRPRPGRSSS